MDNSKKPITPDLYFSRYMNAGDITDEWLGVIGNYRYILRCTYLGKHLQGTHRIVCWIQRKLPPSICLQLFEVFIDLGREKLSILDDYSYWLRHTKSNQIKTDLNVGAREVSWALAQTLIINTTISKKKFYTKLTIIDDERLQKLTEEKQEEVLKRLEDDRLKINHYWNVIAGYALMQYLHPLGRGKVQGINLDKSKPPGV